jgi:Na+/glutamate symporter
VEGSATLGFVIPIAIGGILQTVSEVRGFRATRNCKSLRQQLQDKTTTSQSGKLDQDERRALQEKRHQAPTKHVSASLTLFVLARGAPAGIRLAETIAGGDDGTFPTIMIVVIVFVLQSMGTERVRKMSPPQPNEQEIAPMHPVSCNSVSD